MGLCVWRWASESGRAVIVSGATTARYGVWDLESGAAVGEPLQGHESGI